MYTYFSMKPTMIQNRKALMKSQKRDGSSRECGVGMSISSRSSEDKFEACIVLGEYRDAKRRNALKVVMKRRLNYSGGREGCY